MSDPTCGVPSPTPCLPPRRVLFGPSPGGVISGPAAGPTDPFEIFTPLGPLRVVALVAQSEAIGEPGDVVLIQGRTLRTFSSVQTVSPIRMIDVLDFPSNSNPHASAVKLRVQRCSWPGWIYIDANSHIYMPGGEPFDIQIVAPIGWTQAPNPPAAEVPFDAEFVDVRVTACKARCCPTRRSQLTMYGTIADGDQILVPPGATELAIYAGIGGVNSNTSWQWLVNGFTGGQFQVNGTFVNAYIRPGDMDVLQYINNAASADVVLIWTVE